MAKFDKFLGKIVERVVGDIIDPGVGPDASTSTKGIVWLATGAEVTAGTNTTKAVVPATLKTELDKKVDKVAGKGLSTNDYDNTEKARVAAAETETTLGIDTASGDATKFLNQKKQWVVPAGGSGSAPDASTSTKGIIQLATGAEVTVGTDTAKAVVPATLKTELDKKVDKVAGKGLSDNNYTDADAAKVGKIELETLAELTGENVTIAPWTQSKWSASGACSLTASGWAASGHQIAYIVITLAAGATPSISGTEKVAEDDALIEAGVYECYIKNVDGKKYFRVISFTEAS